MSKKKKSQPKGIKENMAQKKPAFSLKNWWQKNEGENKLIFLFWIGFGVFMLLFYLFTLSDFYVQYIQVPASTVFAHASTAILNVFGEGATASGMNISSNAYSLSIQRGCDAITAIMLLTAAILMFPTLWKKKWKGMGIGTLLLFVLNIIRIVSLYYVGVHAPAYFEFMHIEFWQFVFIGLAMFYFIYWLSWALKPNKDAQAT